MAISERFIQELQERVDIEDVISSHITLRRGQGGYAARA